MSNDFDDYLLILIRGLVPWDNYLSCCQILQLIDLQTEKHLTGFFKKLKMPTPSTQTKVSFTKVLSTSSNAPPGATAVLAVSKVSLQWTHPNSTLTVLPPLPMTLPAAEAGTRMCVSNFTSSLGPKKFSSFSFP